MQIYNTLSGVKENLPAAKKLRLFVCGPTVYDFSHIGHARTYIFFDIFARYLKSVGHKIFYLQNITDIDDKIIARAKKEGLAPLELSAKLTRAYFADMKALGVASVTKYAPATKFIPQIVKQVQTLLKKGYAYEISGDGIYFDIAKFPDYGKLARRTAKQAEDGVSRIDESINKRNVGDFCLWKLADAKNAKLNPNDAKKKFLTINGEPAWNTPLGWGRPGWHIEDTAISEHYFGPQYEIHGGGLDLKFPHHEAEIAQAESASGKRPFVKIWMHTGMLTVGGEKMSKSLNNFITIKDFLMRHPPGVLRFIVLNTHYRSPIDYSEALAHQARNALNSIQEFMQKLEIIKKVAKSKRQEARVKIKKYQREFDEALGNDFNTPEALAAVFSLINEANGIIWNLSKTEARAIKRWLIEKFNIFGIELEIPKTPNKIKDLAQRRELLRRNKQFIQADGLRKKIEALGYKVEDTPIGPLVLRVRK